jgi:HD superfamily phosphohydrolase
MKEKNQIGFLKDCTLYNKDHNRYWHSINVANIMSFINYNFNNVSERIKTLTVKSALLHDIGHVPISHVLENLLQNNNITFKNGNKFHHEDLTNIIIDTLYSDFELDQKKDVPFIKNLILGNYKIYEKDPLLTKEEKFLISLINNDKVDVDRLEYLNTDTKYLKSYEHILYKKNNLSCPNINDLLKYTIKDNNNNYFISEEYSINLLNYRNFMFNNYYLNFSRPLKLDNPTQYESYINNIDMIQNNELIRQYYLNLFTANAEKTKVEAS